MWSEIINFINKNTNSQFELINYKSIGGGCINEAYQLIGKDKSYFVKLNSASQIEMFTAEAIALTEMYNTKTIVIPKPICYGISGNNSYLVLEYLNLGRGNNKSWEIMGQKLALLHQFQCLPNTREKVLFCPPTPNSGGEKVPKVGDLGAVLSPPTPNSGGEKVLKVGDLEANFGWYINNTIGSTPQINDWCENWADFFAEKRIGYQLKLANRRGGNFSNYQEIMEKVRQSLANHNPSPSLVHGDLWSGNAGFINEGEGTIFDPACYYGDREVDIAMTELFGGFPSAFYEGYNQQWALDDGYNYRKNIYNLYHILNHFNLFGGSYESQAKTMIQQIH